MPGVVGHSTDIIEHPELVAQRLTRYAQLVGAENVIAGTDCGLAGRVGHPEIVWAKLEDLAAGARLASRALAGGPLGTGDFAAARDLAAWKRRVRAAWAGVHIEHIEAGDGERGPGDLLPVRASVALGELSPSDVTVEAVCGRVGEDDEIIDPETSPLSLTEPPADGIARFAGDARLGRPGPFGYTVRVVPCHPLLASRAGMGLVTYPAAPAGMTNGDLR